MTIDGLLPLLDGATQTARGWIARCPAHPDRSPSLSIREGSDGRTLLHCFAGCELQAIVAALGLRLADLFPDSRASSEEIARARREREKKRAAEEVRRKREGVRLDKLREAEGLVVRARNIDISAWTDSELDQALDQLADAYHVLATEEGSEWGR